MVGVVVLCHGVHYFLALFSLAILVVLHIIIK